MEPFVTSTIAMNKNCTIIDNDVQVPHIDVSFKNL